jgi:hypothetical protein
VEGLDTSTGEARWSVYERACILWLSDEPDPRDLMRPFPAGPMRMGPISTRVNKREHDDPSIVEPIAPRRAIRDPQICGGVNEYGSPSVAGRRRSGGLAGAGLVFEGSAVAPSGHRHGSCTRSLTGTFGPIEIAVPRARLNTADGKTTEWKSKALRAYQRRTLAAAALPQDNLARWCI